MSITVRIAPSRAKRIEVAVEPAGWRDFIAA